MTTGRKQRLNVEEFTEYSDRYLMVPIYLYTYIPAVDHCLTKHVETRIHANNKLDKHGYRQPYKQSMT